MSNHAAYPESFLTAPEQELVRQKIIPTWRRNAGGKFKKLWFKNQERVRLMGEPNVLIVLFESLLGVPREDYFAEVSRLIDTIECAFPTPMTVTLCTHGGYLRRTLIYQNATEADFKFIQHLSNNSSPRCTKFLVTWTGHSTI